VHLNNNQIIGYQGDQYSNSMEAAARMAKKLSLSDVTLLPLISSQGVVNALLGGTIKFGVMAVENTLAGTVIETEKALSGLRHETLCTEQIHIHHCLFKLPDTDDGLITVVASHIQALSQCEKNLNLLLPGSRRLELKDTAIGARYLREGKLPASTAVLCRRDAGEAYRLTMMAENVEDSDRNFTTFCLVKLRE